MDPMDCYISAARMVLLANPADPSTWRELHALLKVLREHFSCRVCRMLVDRPNPHPDGFSCTVCVNTQVAADAKPIDVSFLNTFKLMCNQVLLMKPLYNAMRARDEDRRLVELLNEVTGPPDRLVNGMAAAAIIQEPANCRDKVRSSPATPVVKMSSSVKIETPNVNGGLQTFDAQQPANHKIENQPKPNNVMPTKKKKNERRPGCRCGKASSFPGKLTCFGQRCPCYTEQRPCDQCKCRGCRNPRQKQSDNDDNLEQDKTRRKPVTLELVSSLKPSHMKRNPTYDSYLVQDRLQFSSVSTNGYDQVGAEVTLGHVNSIFHSP